MKRTFKKLAHHFCIQEHDLKLSSKHSEVKIRGAFIYYVTKETDLTIKDVADFLGMSIIKVQNNYDSFEKEFKHSEYVSVRMFDVVDVIVGTRVVSVDVNSILFDMHHALIRSNAISALDFSKSQERNHLVIRNAFIYIMKNEFNVKSNKAFTDELGLTTNIVWFALTNFKNETINEKRAYNIVKRALLS